MKKVALPKNLKGNWIWLSADQHSYCERLLLRHEFVLEDIEPNADFWVSASYSYHLYVNGTHIGFGPASAPVGSAYVDYYDISMYLQQGSNVIALVATEMALPTYLHQRQTPGIWCQMNLNDLPYVWADKYWKCFSLNHFDTGAARRHYGLEFVEKLDYSLLPRGWKQEGFDDSSWRNPDLLGLIGGRGVDLVPYPCTPCTVSDSQSYDPVMTGSFIQEWESTHVSFQALPDPEKEGVYAAKTFVNLKEPVKSTLAIASDTPFMLFLNDVCVASRGTDCASSVPLDFIGHGDDILTEIKVSLEKGWNRILFVQRNIAPTSMGAMFYFPQIKEGTFTFLREPDPEALHGWRIAGPLRMPLKTASSSLSMDRIPSIPFTPIQENINDVSTWLNTCKFTPSEETASADPLLLHENEYALFDLEQLSYGFPDIRFEGAAGDVIDVTCGTEIQNGKIVSVGRILGRNTDSVVLADGGTHYMRLEPRGARFLMISVRKASSAGIRVISTGFSTFLREMWEFANDFTCSDEEFNSIWKNAVEALQQSANLSLMDNPCGKRSQSMLESFIQSLATFYLFGDTALSEKALREFAAAQTENGVFPEDAVSGVRKYDPVRSLYWAIWLDYHWNNSGDREFLDRMMPHLEDLLEYFRCSTIPTDGIIHNKTLVRGIEPQTGSIYTDVNALYCRALLSSTHLFEACGKSEQADTCRRQAAKNAELLRSLLWNKTTGLFADFTVKGKRSDSSSAFTNFLAMISGIAPLDSMDTVVRKCITENSDLKTDLLNADTCLFLLEMLFSFGSSETAFDLIRKTFAATSAELLTRKNIKKHLRNKNENHISAILPAYFLMRELLGVRPARPGMSQIYFHPAYQLVSSAKGRITTPYGKITVDWKYENEELTVTVDSNYPVDIMPEFPPEMFEHCTFQLGNSVSVLDPDSASEPEAKN